MYVSAQRYIYLPYAPHYIYTLNSAKMLKRVQHDRLVCYILVNLFITLILLCHPEFTALLVADNRRLTREGARRVFQNLSNRKLYLIF